MPGLRSLHALLPSPLELFVRIGVVAAVMLALAQAFQRELVSSMIPTLHAIVELLSDDFTILDMSLGESGASETLKIRFNLARIVVVNGLAAYPLGWTPATAGWMQVSLTIGSIVQHALMLAIIVIAWPAVSMREFCMRLLVALPASAVLLLIDVPLTILAEFWFPIHDAFDQGAFWPLLAWSRFLMGGGGLMLAISMAILCIAAAKFAEAPGGELEVAGRGQAMTRT